MTTRQRPTHVTRGLFIAGTDTEVGKTRTAVAIIAAAVGHGLRVAPMKPVASGAARTEAGLRNEDALKLLEAANLQPPYDRVNPCVFEPPIAPHIAAAQAGAPIDIERLRMSYQAVAAEADLVVVEGVGGWLVPLGPDTSMADLPRALHLPVVLTVGMRLGCLNHALLTAAAIRDAGLHLAGWIANLIEPELPYLQENLLCLDARLNAPCLGVLPFCPSPSTAALGAAIDFPVLLQNASTISTR